MNLDNQIVESDDQIEVMLSLNAPLLSISITPKDNVVVPNNNQLIIYVEDFYADNVKTYVYDLQYKLEKNNNLKNRFLQIIDIEDNEPTLVSKLYCRIPTTSEYDLDPQEIVLFKGFNRIYTNYENVTIKINYLKDSELNRCYCNNLMYLKHKENSNELTLDDLYFKDAFTKTGNELNEEIDNLNVKCISSKNNTFSLDSQGNLIVNTITTNSMNGVVDLIYPVGSIYMSVNSTNPATLFGGTWQQIEDDAYLKIVNSNAGSLGGTSSNHTIPLSSIPSHNHSISSMRNCGVSQGGFYGVACNNSEGAPGMTTDNRGGGNPYYPYYYGVYVWKRIS